MRQIAVLGVLAMLGSTAAAVAQYARRHASGADRGLVAAPAAFMPWHDDPSHPLNRVFRSLWLRRMVPAEVAAVVRPGDAFEWREGWVHRKRAGAATDERWFGGDG